MANKYAREPEPTLFDTPKEKVRNVIGWRCYRCDQRGKVPILIDTPTTEIIEAIQRGHERKNPACDEKHRMRHVRVTLQNGTKVSYGMFGAASTTPAVEPQSRV